MVAMLLALMAGGVGPAAAHGEQSDEAAVLVRQAIALIVSSPDDLGEIEEKTSAALEAPDPSGVDLALVQQADAALAAGEDVAQVRVILERSIGAGPVGGPAEESTVEEPEPQAATAAEPEPAPSAEPLPSEAWAAAEPESVQSADPAPSESGTAAVPGDGGMDQMATGADPGSTLIAEPLETAPQLDATDWIVLAGSILVGLIGVWLILRYRPATGREAT